MADERKLKAVLAHIAERTSPGKLKMFKLLYLVDFTAYVRLGNSITEEAYEAWENGPVPRHFWENFKRITSECLDIEERQVRDKLPEQRMKAKPDAGDLSVLSDEERAVLEEVITRYGNRSGNSLRELTHAELPYRLTERNNVMPYYLAAYRGYRKAPPSALQKMMNDRGVMGRLRESIVALYTPSAE
jgi:uncharacterized phage-associated protein